MLENSSALQMEKWRNNIGKASYLSAAWMCNQKTIIGIKYIDQPKGRVIFRRILFDLD